MSSADRHEAGPGISVCVVTHDSADALRRSLPPLVSELRPGDELIVCDNRSSDGTPAVVRELAPGALVIQPGTNDGFGAGCAMAAAAATKDLLLMLNPDVVVEAGFRAEIVRPLLDRRGWDAWQGLVTDGAGELVNSSGGVVHFTGIAWAGGAGSPVADAPAEPREVPFPSGACLAIRREAWEALGGFSDEYFLYHEDTDLGLRLWLEGHRVGIEPRARCDHDYDFDKGPAKWLYLERNRWATIIRTYPSRLLLLLLPALLATEVALLVVAARGGWLGRKLAATAQLIGWIPRLRVERRAIQASARVDDARFASQLESELTSAYLGGAAESRLLRALLGGYWRLVLRLL